jgi:hypothetical protein
MRYNTHCASLALGDKCSALPPRLQSHRVGDATCSQDDGLLGARHTCLRRKRID